MILARPVGLWRNNNWTFIGDDFMQQWEHVVHRILAEEVKIQCVSWFWSDARGGSRVEPWKHDLEHGCLYLEFFLCNKINRHETSILDKMSGKTYDPKHYEMDCWNDNDKAYSQTSCNIRRPLPLNSHWRRSLLTDRQTKVVKLVTELSRSYTKYGCKLYHSYFTKSISLVIWIQITIHPLSTDGAIVI